VRVLVTAASRHDATREIAEAIADGLSRRGVDAEARPVDQVTSLDGFDAVVIGSAIYMGRWLSLDPPKVGLVPSGAES
jgi:menaquinone-dependent protoporphyrinogen oxidase